MEVREKYEKLIDGINKDIKEAEGYKADIMRFYVNEKEDIGINRTNLDEMIKAQGMMLKIQDYISQKEMTKTELIRQMD